MMYVIAFIGGVVVGALLVSFVAYAAALNV